MAQEKPLSPPFNVGETYEDEISEFSVVSIEGARMTIRRPNGELQHSDNISLKAEIYRRRLRERENPKPINYRPAKSGSAQHAYHDDDVTWMVAKCIAALAKHSKDCIPHKRIVERLLDDASTRRIIEEINRSSKDQKDLEGRAGQIIARFSRECRDGKWRGYKKRKITVGHCWTVEKR
ncbi:MAG: hypothetical protein WA197_26500 [Candidatus Acidiferrales bacterium]